MKKTNKENKYTTIFYLKEVGLVKKTGLEHSSTC